MNRASKAALQEFLDQQGLPQVACRQASSRLSLTLRPCGEMRLSRHRHPYRQPSATSLRQPSSTFREAALQAREVARATSLVYSDEVQVHRMGGFGVRPRETSFTRLAKYRVRDACAILKKLYGKQIIFATGTLPGSTPRALQAIADYSGLIVSRLEQWIRQQAPSAHYAFVWELQARGALHIHVAIGSPYKRQLKKLKQKFRSYWFGLLHRIGALANVDMFGRSAGGTWKNSKRTCRANCQWIRKDLGRYMSKYLSKGSKRPGAKVYCPSAWFGMDKRLKKLVKQGYSCVISPLVSPEFAPLLYDSLKLFVTRAVETVFFYRNKICADEVTVAYPREGDGLSILELASGFFTGLPPLLAR